jgi:hypothetical protein
MFNCSIVVAGLCVVPMLHGEPLNEALFRIQKLFDVCDFLLDQNLRFTLDAMSAEEYLISKKKFLVAEVYAEFSEVVAPEVNNRRDHVIKTLENILSDTTISLMGLNLKIKKNTYSESRS